MAMRVPMARRKHEVLTLQDKHKVIEQLDKGVSPSEIMLEFNCGKSTISNLKTNSKKILSGIAEIEKMGGSKKRKTFKRGSYNDVEMAIYMWFLQEAEEPRYLDQSSPKRPYNFTDDFMVKSQQINSRLVKDG